MIKEIMTVQLHSTSTLSLFGYMSSRDIAAYYYGTYLLLRDLQDLQLAGKRLPGGFSARIQIASGYYDMVNNALRELARTDSEKVRDVIEYLAISSEPTLQHETEKLAAFLTNKHAL